MRNQFRAALAFFVGTLLLTGCGGGSDEQIADTIYLGGPILTMEGDEPEYAEALLVKDGRIHFVGSLAEADSVARARNRVDLDGRALLPGFIDAHGHAFIAGIQKLTANLLPPPDGEGRDVASLVTLMADWAAENEAAIERAGWIIGFGYDDAQLAEQRHPTATDLDQVSVDVSVVAIHQSGHLAAMNHKGLEVAGFTAGTPDPPGGIIRREADGGTIDQMPLP